MCRKILSILTGVLLLAHPSVIAQDVSGYPVGYCNGEMSNRSDIKFSEKGAAVSAAIHIPTSYAASIGGNRLEAVSVALASKLNLNSLEVWVRTSLDGENITSKSVEKSDLVQGWNNISLDTPYDIPTDPGDGFYIGYTYVQSNKAGAISTLPTPHAGGLFVKCNDQQWSDRSDEGTLCIEGMAYGDNLPKHDLGLLSITTDPYYIISQGGIACVAKVINLATVTATGFDIEARVENVDQPVIVHVDCDIPSRETKSYKFHLSADILSAFPEKREVLFTIVSVDGNDDENAADNSASTSFEVIENAFPRNVLAEEFTTEFCPNCPRVAEYFHELLADPVFVDNLNVVCHHAGYYTDPLTTSFDEAYCWFYNSGGSTYAPAVMVDRMTYQNTDTPVFSPDSKAELENDIITRLGIPAMVSVVPSCFIDATGTISVTVVGERVRDNSFNNDRITVWLVEDNIQSANQAGAGGIYIHNHVNRAVNATWGEPIIWNGNNYSYSCSFHVDDSWNMKNLSIVAFVSSYNPENPNDCAVANSGRCLLSSSSVTDNLSSDNNRRIIRIYNASGTQTNVLSPGVNIVVYDDFSTTKVISNPAR